MPRSKNSNTKVYKVRQDLIHMAMGYLTACLKYAPSVGNESQNIYIDETVKKFNLSEFEVAMMIQSFVTYTDFEDN
jgi:hypothetical protein